MKSLELREKLRDIAREQLSERIKSIQKAPPRFPRLVSAQNSFTFVFRYWLPSKTSPIKSEPRT